MHLPRSAGVLLHLTSLPGPFGVGDLGGQAHGFVDFLARAGQSFWQLLPLGPADGGGCPYVAQSSWAGGPHLIALEELARAGDLEPAELDRARPPAAGALAPAGAVDHAFVARSRQALLARAAERFFARADVAERAAFERFCEAEASWLDDWSLFAALKKQFGGAPWWTWPRPLALRTADGLRAARAELGTAIRAEQYAQMRFYEQLEALRRHAAERGVRLIGDVPIYCARDSADVWAAPGLFQLDADGGPRAVSGVPPDYFAQDGQLWGSPVYDWPANAAQGFRWWIARLRAALRQTDLVRIDHFRAFESYWEIPATARTAREGRWVPGPGDALFAAAREALGEAPFIAEDLGVITRAVRGLRDRWELPGMRVLQFAFGEGAASPHLPLRYVRNSVVYTGTHDNDTTAGWYAKASERERDAFRRYTSSDGGACHYHMIRLAYGSIADLAVVPMQDVLGLGSEARMNVPGVVDGNWRWRVRADQMNDGAARMLRELAETFGRLPGQREASDDEGNEPVAA